MKKEQKIMNPYEQLRASCKTWANHVLRPCTVAMLFYNKKNLSVGFTLDDLYERVKAADQLGYDVKLLALDNGLHVRYVKRPPAAPWQIS
jgi:hypothetical protein